MRLEVEHHRTPQEAIQKLDGFLEGLIHGPFPAGVELTDIQRNWNGHNMDFCFTARKGFFATTIDGRLEVTATQIVLDSALPLVVTALLGEEKIKSAISQRLTDLFNT